MLCVKYIDSLVIDSKVVLYSLHSKHQHNSTQVHIYEEITVPQTTGAGQERAEPAASSTVTMEENLAYLTHSAAISTSHNEAYGNIHHQE